MAWWLAAMAYAGDLDRDALLAAEWSRDADTLLAASVGDADLGVYVRALGRLRDPRACERLTVLGRVPSMDLRRAVAEALAWTPGCAGTVRARLDVEDEPAVRRALWLALGEAGDAEDVDRAVAALAGPEAASAALALGRLGVRSVPGVERAASALVAVIRPGRPEVVRAAAFALRRTRDAELSPAERDALAAAWPRLGDEVAQAWLVPALAPLLDPADRRAFVRNALAGPSRLVQVAVLGVAGPDDLGDDGWGALARSPDPWLRLRAAERAPAAAQPATLAEALASGPAVRAAERWLDGDGIDDADLDRLVASDDFAVRELAAGWLGEHPARAGGRFAALMAAGGPPSTWVTVLGAARAAGWAPDAASREAVRALATGGPFLVRDRAIDLLAATGEVVPRQPVAPGPPDLDPDPSALALDVVTTDGTFRVALDPATAPLACAALVWLARRDQLDGTPVHRVVPGFVVQSGDPRGDGYGGPDWLLPDEVSALPFTTGSVGMARSDRDTGGSQWFVTTSPQPHLVGEYTRLGEVVDGLDVVLRLDTDDRVLDVQVVER